MKKLKFVIPVSVVIVGLVVLGVFFYLDMKDKPNKVFHDYLSKTASSTEYGTEEVLYGTGVKGTGVVKYDAKNKLVNLSAELQCKGNVDGEEVGLDVTLVQENLSRWIRFDKVTGKTTDVDGSEIDLATVYDPIKGNWYDASEEDLALKSMLDNGIFVGITGVIAPGKDSERIASRLVESGAISIKSSKMSGSNYEYEISVTRTEYEKVLKELFPELTNIDLILDTVLEDEGSSTVTITTDASGSSIREEYPTSGICYEFVTYFTGVEPTNIAKTVTAESVTKKPQDLEFKKPVDAKPIDALAADLGYVEQ